MSYCKYNIDKNDIRFQKIIENSKWTYQFYKNICEHLDTFIVSSKHYLVIFLLLLSFLNKMENETKKKKKIEIEKKVDYLLKITFDFTLKQCKRSYDEKADRILDIK